jgi:hypothetical protein
MLRIREVEQDIFEYLSSIPVAVRKGREEDDIFRELLPGIEVELVPWISFATAVACVALSAK